jgi:DNA-binding transcriptional LysR family regulator
MTEFTLRQLAYFVAAADQGTTAAAAQAHGISQSAMSSALTDLERALGVQLLFRNKAKGVTLTQAGREALPEARRLLAAAEELQSHITDVGNEPTGRLAIGCFTDFAPFVLPPLLRDFASRYPRIEPDFTEGGQVELQDQLMEGRCELALLWDIGLRPGITTHELHPLLPRVLLPPGHRLAHREAVSARDLAAEPLILLTAAPGTDFVQSVFAAAQSTPKVRFRTERFEHARALVAHGLGYTLYAQPAALDPATWAGDMVVRPLSDPVPPRPLVLAHPTGARLTRRAQLFLRHCMDGDN